MNLYVKLPFELARSEPENVLHFSRIYMAELSAHKFNLRSYSRKHNVNYNTCRRLQKLARQMINKEKK